MSKSSIFSVKVKTMASVNSYKNWKKKHKAKKRNLKKFCEAERSKVVNSSAAYGARGWHSIWEQIPTWKKSDRIVCVCVRYCVYTKELWRRRFLSTAIIKYFNGTRSIQSVIECVVLLLLLALVMVMVVVLLLLAKAFLCKQIESKQGNKSNTL